MRYRVFVKFNKDFIYVDEAGKRITIGVRSKPLKNKANEEIIKKLAKHFGIPSSDLRIVGGKRSKNKTVEIIE